MVKPLLMNPRLMFPGVPGSCQHPAVRNLDVHR